MFVIWANHFAHTLYGLLFTANAISFKRDRLTGWLSIGALLLVIIYNVICIFYKQFKFHCLFLARVVSKWFYGIFFSFFSAPHLLHCIVRKTIIHARASKHTEKSEKTNNTMGEEKKRRKYWKSWLNGCEFEHKTIHRERQSETDREQESRKGRYNVREKCLWNQSISKGLSTYSNCNHIFWMRWGAKEMLKCEVWGDGVVVDQCALMSTMFGMLMFYGWRSNSILVCMRFLDIHKIIIRILKLFASSFAPSICRCGMCNR